MKIAAVMPIKLHNERCPGKNTRLLGGKPLLQHQLEALLATKRCDTIEVYCSSEEIIPLLPDGVSFRKRDPKLDLPTSNFTQIFDAYSKEVDADIYVFAHATAPFITVETIQECISAVVSEKHDSAFGAIKLQDYLWKDGEPLNFDAANIPRTQDLEPIYQEVSGVYVFRRDVFKNMRRRVGANPYIKELSIRETVDIDEPEDFAFAETMLSHPN